MNRVDVFPNEIKHVFLFSDAKVFDSTTVVHRGARPVVVAVRQNSKCSILAKFSDWRDVGAYERNAIFERKLYVEQKRRPDCPKKPETLTTETETKRFSSSKSFLKPTSVLKYPFLEMIKLTRTRVHVRFENVREFRR